MSVPVKHSLPQALHGQSVLSRLQKEPARAVHLSAAYAQSNYLEGKRMRSAFMRLSRSLEKRAASRLRYPSPESLVFSRVIYPQAQFQRQLGI